MIPFDWQLAAKILPLLLNATLVTVAITFLSFALALLLGLPLLLLRRSRNALLARTVGFAIEFLRSTPLLIQIYFLYFVLPHWGIALSPFVTGVLAMSVHYGCYMSEVYRSGLDDLPKGQWDAAIAVGFNRFDVYRCMVIPQVIPRIVPAAGNFLVYMFKDSPLLASISVAETMFVAAQIGADRFQYLEPITLCGLIFLGLSLGGSALTRLVEWRIGRVWLGRA
jgi:polar amino acid transport system permease protein